MAYAFEQRDCPDGGHTPTNEKIPDTPMVDTVQARGGGSPMGESTPGPAGPPAHTELCDHMVVFNLSLSRNVPAFSFVEPISRTDSKIEVERPSADSLKGAIVVEEEIEIRDTILVCKPFPTWPKWVTLEPGDAAIVGDEVGTETDSYTAHAGKRGFEVLAVDGSAGLVLVQPSRCETLTLHNMAGTLIPKFSALEIDKLTDTEIWVKPPSAANLEEFITFDVDIPAVPPLTFPVCKPYPGLWPKIVRCDAAVAVNDWVGIESADYKVYRDRFGFEVYRRDVIDGEEVAEVMPAVLPTAGTANADIPAGAVGAVQRTDGDFGAVGLPVDARNAGQGQINTGQHCILGVYKGKPFCLSSGGSTIILHNTDVVPILGYGMMEVVVAGSTPDYINVKVPTQDSPPNLIADYYFPNPSSSPIPAGGTIAVPKPCPAWPMWVLYTGADPVVGHEVGTTQNSCYVQRPTGSVDHFGFTIVEIVNTTLKLALIRPIDWPVAFKLQTNIGHGGSGDVKRCDASGTEYGTEFKAKNVSTDCDANTGDIVMGGLAPSGSPFFEGGAAPP